MERCSFPFAATIMCERTLVNTMRLLKIILIPLMLCSIGVLSLNCASDSAPALEGRAATVQRGDLRIDITGVGNLALSQKIDLAFEMDGTVAEVLVEEADPVEEGQVLARLDTSAWEDHIAGLEDEATAAERNVTAKERAVTAKERAVTQAERQVTAKKLDLLQAEVNVENAKLALTTTEAETTDRLEIEVKELQVELAEFRLEDARIAVEDAATAGLEDARIAVDDAKIAVDDAKKALEDARKTLDEAMKASPEVTAPFAGFITMVNVSGGDEVKKGTVAVTLADPTKFEAEVMVSEVDISQVKLGGAASVQVEAMQGMSLPAKVTHIPPTATIQSGVVNYKVKVEIEPLQSATQDQQETRQDISSSELSERMKQAVEEGRLTQEQAEERMQQQGTRARGQQAQSSSVPEDFKLAEGLTVTVSILTAERNDVLLVPSQAITSRGRQAYVQVVSPEGVTEERLIQTGISDWQYTEVTDGLSEGEQVVVPETATTTPQTTQQTTRQTTQGPGGSSDPMRQLQRAMR